MAHSDPTQLVFVDECGTHTSMTPRRARALRGARARARGSIGAATGHPGEDPDELMARADRSMYGTKARRRVARDVDNHVRVTPALLTASGGGG